MAPIGVARRRLVQRTISNSAPLLLQVCSSTPPSCSTTAAAPSPSPSPRWGASGRIGTSISYFSTTSSLSKRRVQFRDNNPDRGVSALYRSGPREPRSVSQVPLPKPRKLDMTKLAAERVDPNHGLWGFFYDHRPSNTPAESQEHGRAWTVEELRAKSWEDLHGLWWTCCLERNRIATAKNLRSRYEMGFGNSEADDRDQIVRATLKAIKHTLTERHYTWEDAVDLARSDPEINLSGGEGAAYTPKSYLSGPDPSVVVNTEEEEEKKVEADIIGPLSTTTAVDPATLPQKDMKETRERGI